MKRIILYFSPLMCVFVLSCGPSAEEQAKMEQARLDSIAKVEADSLQKVAEDSIAAAMQAMEDSIAAAERKMLEDSIAKLSGQVKGIQQKVKSQKAKEEKIEKEYQSQSKGKG